MTVVALVKDTPVPYTVDPELIGMLAFAAIVLVDVEKKYPPPVDIADDPVAPVKPVGPVAPVGPVTPVPLLLQLFLVCLVFRSVQLHQSLPSDLLLPPDPLHLVDLGFPVDLVDQLLQSGRLLQSDPLPLWTLDSLRTL